MGKPVVVVTKRNPNSEERNPPQKDTQTLLLK